jgi:hypothetical protein
LFNSIHDHDYLPEKKEIIHDHDASKLGGRYATPILQEGIPANIIRYCMFLTQLMRRKKRGGEKEIVA